ncbi:MAG: hypothetical protein ACKVT1_19895 [Dehalococcoidia bacterium]
MKAATQVWLGLALLHREHGRNADFTRFDIERRIAAEPWAGGVTPSTIAAHVAGHCVGSARPSPDRDRMLTRTTRGRYRLYRPGDSVHPGRASGRMMPDAADLPPSLTYLLAWYEDTYAGRSRERAMDELIAGMRASGIWRRIDPDAFIREQRASWDE